MPKTLIKEEKKEDYNSIQQAINRLPFDEQLVIYKSLIQVKNIIDEDLKRIMK